MLNIEKVFNTPPPHTTINNRLNVFVITCFYELCEYFSLKPTK